MRCANLVETWDGLRSWLDQHSVLVLPCLHSPWPMARLDADTDQTKAACPEELARVVNRLHAVIERFDVRAVYVQHLLGERDHDTNVDADGIPGTRDGGDLGIVTVRAVAGGVVHELTLFAAWYADYLDHISGTGFADSSPEALLG